MSDFPAWFYGPGGAAQIFAAAEDVPEGWADTPAAFEAAPLTTEDAAPVVVEAPAKRGPGRPRKDAA